MREIKFRAWDKKRKKMFLVAELNNSLLGTYIYSDSYAKGFVKASTQDKDISIMQFTGLKDNNDNEIYESDLVKYTIGKFTEKGKIVFSHGCFWIKFKSRQIELYLELENIELIGNEFENPELLKGGK